MVRRCVVTAGAALLVLALALGGCSSGGGGSAAVNGCDNLAGTWNYTITQQGGSNCPLIDGIDFDGDGRADSSYSGTWQVVVNGQSVTISEEGELFAGTLTCDGANFSVTVRDTIEGVNVTLVIAGTFTSEDDAEGTATLTAGRGAVSCSLRYNFTFRR
jgi:hypothetical protein